MSYILDALKKSDLERQQLAGSRLAQVQRQQFFFARERSGRWLAPAVIGAGLLVAVAGAYHQGWLAVQWPGSQSPSASAASAAGAPAAAVPPASALAASSTEAAGPVLGEQPAEPAGEPEYTTVAPTPQADRPPRPAAGEVPELWQLPLSLRAAVPALDFSLHVYSNQPEQRSIIINNRMMREGEAVNGDLTLVAITPQGVVMRLGEAQFRVGVLEDW